jgi:hypothetical protein
MEVPKFQSGGGVPLSICVKTQSTTKTKKRIKKKDVKKVVIRSVGNHKSNMGRGFSQIWLYIAVKVEK